MTKNRPYMAGAPVRRVVIRSPHRAVGLFPSRKMQGDLPWESHIERDFVMLAEFDPAISKIEAQPERFRYQTLYGVARTIPDFAIVRNGQRVIIECKSDRDAQRPELVEKFDLIRAAYAEKGIPYEVWTPSMIRNGYRLSICQLMWRYARKQARNKAGAINIALCIPDHESRTVGSLMMDRAQDLPALAEAFYRGLITFDFNKPFTDETLVSRSFFHA